MEKFCIFSTINAGWLTSGAVYSSDITQAWEMPKDQALAICQRHYRKEGNVAAYVMVDAGLLKEIANG